MSYDSLERGHEWAVRWGPLERDLRRHCRDDAGFTSSDIYEFPVGEDFRHTI